jgi:hypothetical protein
MKGFIYVIKSKQTTDVYYGSTIQKINRRLQIHQSEYRRYLIGNHHYVSSFEIIQYNDAFIELVETVEYEDKEELTKREGYYIQNHDCVNKHIEGRTKKEWFKQWREKNRDKIRENDRLRYHKKKEGLL